VSGDSSQGQNGRSSDRTELVQRITVLLGEIEALGQQSSDVPSPLLTEMLAILEQARRGLAEPDVDQEILARIYRALGTGRTPKR
jgi:hypothetical protein